MAKWEKVEICNKGQVASGFKRAIRAKWILWGKMGPKGHMLLMWAQKGHRCRSGAKWAMRAHEAKRTKWGPSDHKVMKGQ